MARGSGASTDDLLIQLKILNRLVAAQLKPTMKQNELVALLASTGATSQEIADVLDTTASVVQVTLHRRRKKSAE
jgi:DNA-directed RNA polymerase specialized sigma24 family protein